MNKPTEEQLKEFWEWCGFREVLGSMGVKVLIPPDKNRFDATGADLLLTLDNLFKYAVPKLMENDYSLRLTASKLVADHSDSYNVRITKFLNWEKDIIIQGADPALALFWAIWEVTHG
jgi:hypothetical protein